MELKTTAELVSPLLSWKIKLTSLICITFVLYIHSFFSVETVGALRDFQLVFIRGFCDVAVPTFFAMSGFLFFVGTNVAGEATGLAQDEAADVVVACPLCRCLPLRPIVAL